MARYFQLRNNTTGEPLPCPHEEAMIQESRTVRRVRLRVQEHVSAAAPCSICLGDIEDERVGDLNCGHVFHVECLKEWIQHKNACPFCQERLAEPL